MAGERINQEAIETINPFAGPVPGESLTSSPESSQAWEQPPAYTSVREATQDIFLNLLEDEMLETVVTMLANGTPVGDITKMLLVSGLSQGKFNPDLMLLLVEPVMYMILAIAERVGIKDIKLYRGEEDEPEPLDQEETEIYLNESAAHKNSIRNPREESFANLKVNNIGANQVDQELINQLENIDVSGLREKIGLMARPEPREQGTESLMSREGYAFGGLLSAVRRAIKVGKPVELRKVKDKALDEAGKLEEKLRRIEEEAGIDVYDREAFLNDYGQTEYPSLNIIEDKLKTLGSAKLRTYKKLEKQLEEALDAHEQIKDRMVEIGEDPWFYPEGLDESRKIPIGSRELKDARRETYQAYNESVRRSRGGG
jgi:hypothetical protein